MSGFSTTATSGGWAGLPPPRELPADDDAVAESGAWGMVRWLTSWVPDGQWILGDAFSTSPGSCVQVHPRMCGAVELEGSGLPKSEILEPLVLKALQTALTAPGAFPPDVHLSGLRLDGVPESGVTLIRFEVRPHASEVASTQAQLLREVDHQGALQLLPELMTLLEAQPGSQCAHCRLRLHVGRLPSVTFQSRYASAVPPPLLLPLNSHPQPQVAEKDSGCQSPTLQNLQKDRTLRDRVMAGALPIGPDGGIGSPIVRPTPTQDTACQSPTLHNLQKDRTMRDRVMAGALPIGFDGDIVSPTVRPTQPHRVRVQDPAAVPVRVRQDRSVTL